MAIQKLADYLTKNDLGSSGLPQGDTFIDLDTTEIEEGEYEGKKTWKAKLADGKEFNLPKSVLREMQTLAKEGIKKVRVTRTGKTQTDTKYTVVKQ